MRKQRTVPLTLFSFQDILTSLMGVVFLIVLLLSLQMIHQAPVVSDLSKEEAAKLQQAVSQMEAERQDLENRLHRLYQQTKIAVQRPQQLQERRDQLQQQCQRLLDEGDSEKKVLDDLTRQKEALEKELHEGPERSQLKKSEQKLAQIRVQLDQIRAEDLLIFNPAPGGKKPWMVDLDLSAWRVISGETLRPATTFSQQPLSRRIVAFLQWAKVRDRRSEYFVLFVRPGAINAYEELRKVLEKLGFELGVDLLGDNQKLLFAKGLER